jgi:hypothetical protein
MNTIRATITDGRLEVNVPADWPDGTEVEIHALGRTAEDEDMVPPEEIAKLLADMDQLEPLDLTKDELAACKAERQARKELEKAQFAQHAGKLQGMWE